MNTSALRTASRHTSAGGWGSAEKYAISTGMPSARITADSAASTNDRPTGNRRSSDVWLKNTRLGDAIAHSVPVTRRDDDRSLGRRVSTPRRRPQGRLTASLRDAMPRSYTAFVSRRAFGCRDTTSSRLHWVSAPTSVLIPGGPPSGRLRPSSPSVQTVVSGGCRAKPRQLCPSVGRHPQGQAWG